jgi:hypothetical protein
MTNTSTKERKPYPRWPLFLIASPAAVAVWSGWVGLGGLCGFGVIHPLPGIWDSLRINTAITLPIGVEAYGAYALGAWLHSGTPKTAKKFARRSSIGSLTLGTLGQVAYHLLAATGAVKAPWWITMVVAALPVITLGFGAGLTHLLREQDADTDEAAEEDETVAVRPPMYAAWPEPEETDTKRPAERTRTAGESRYLRRAMRKYKRNPTITGEEMGAYLGVSDRHGRRILAEVKEALAAEAGEQQPVAEAPIPSTDLTAGEAPTEDPIAA